MTDDRRWAARYAFLEDLWRDRPRVIVDARLESVLRSGTSRRTNDDNPIEQLVDALVPRVPKARTWVAVTDEAVARELAQTRPGTGFLPRSSFADVVEHREWSVALVELAALSGDAVGGDRLARQLAARAADGRTVIVAARASASPGDDEDEGFAALSELLETQLGGGRIFGIYRPQMAAVVDFGTDDDEDDDDDDDVALTFDNTLGPQAPGFVEYLGVAGDLEDLPEGMTLVELPAAAGRVDRGEGDDGLRAQLVQAQRQAELAAIDRQALLEKVDQLEAAHGTLTQQATELRDRLARAVTEEAPASSEAAERLQASLADNQALRWRVQQLDRELADARARPVEDLEAEVARLRAEVAAAAPVVASPPAADDAAAVEPGEAAKPDQAIDAMAGLDEEFDEPGQIVVMVPEADDLADRVRRGQTLRELDSLVARVERGGIGALQLRQALVSLRRRLDG
ncbi:MAG: hypothetical protein K0V04_05580 [Deltaproteobacteria bacterium]|nr:hypothetical protein [Deltaproteobacteria bacterium]